jgi:hypothetical protein
MEDAMGELFQAVRAPQGAWSDVLMALVLLVAGALPTISVGWVAFAGLPGGAAVTQPDPCGPCLPRAR